MHSATTRNEFLRLRAQGLSLASLGRQLGVSKPTLITWSRQFRSSALHSQPSTACAAAANQQLAGLHRKLTALRQELFSRALRDIPTPDLETLAGQLRQRIRLLEPLESGGPPPQPGQAGSLPEPDPAPNPPGLEPMPT